MTKEQNYAVGYKKPPKKNQFKKGSSGNPSGRAKDKSAVLFNDVIIAELCTTLVVNEGGKPVKVSKLELIGKDLVNRVFKGDKDARKRILDFIKANNHSFPGVVAESNAVAEFRAKLLAAAKEIGGDDFKL